MDARFEGTHRDQRRTIRPVSARFSGFEMLMFGLLGIALADCVGLAWLFIRGIN